jgi:hypothetical protein
MQVVSKQIKYEFALFLNNSLLSEKFECQVFFSLFKSMFLFFDADYYYLNTKKNASFVDNACNQAKIASKL